MSTSNRLDLQTVESQPVMPENLPDHCIESLKFRPNSQHPIVILREPMLTSNLM